jgi:hypothetical protein
MNPVMLSLELLLAALLVATLLFGLRLERRLRAFRESQAGFMKAMGDLDGAASRTEAGLDTLRRAGLEARDTLGPQIEAARALIARLDAATGEAELAAKRAEAAALEVKASARTLAGALPTERRQAPTRVREAAPQPPPEPAAAPRLRAPDFEAMLKTGTTRQPLPSTPESQPVAGVSRLREAAALLRGGR